ncbi:hypothetical protein CXF43_01435 [Corynebacterium bovis]|nr:hypothetical protein CXF43_01435 [Corynebacterium bovis]RRQ10450.1 hypothetical protein CXF44_04000 [Corynebacterium bovis]
MPAGEGRGTTDPSAARAVCGGGVPVTDRATRPLLIGHPHGGRGAEAALTGVFRDVAGVLQA